MQKTKSSMYNAIVTLISTALSSILALISTNLILKNYGSDFNGVVATVNQLLNVLLLVEGGFTLAINVALFKYYVGEKEKEINQILAASNKIFKKIGLIFLIIGILFAIIYPIFIKSNLEYLTIMMIFFMIILSTFFNIIFTTKYRIMFQTAQKEYKISLIGMVVNNISSLVTIGLVYFNVDMLIVRFFVMIFAIINGILIAILFKKEFPKYKFKGEEPKFNEIVGTKDIMAQKITGAIYTSAPIFFISTFVSTLFSSIYAVYNSIYSVIKMVLATLVASPTNGFGLLIIEKDKKYVYEKFKQYEYIIILVTNLLITPVIIMIIPFIQIYTNSVTDINYINYGIAYMMATIIVLEIVHLPSGNIINMSGNFKIAKKIQYITTVILSTLLLAGGIIGGTEYGIYAILLGTIITNIILAYMEIAFVHKKYFESTIKNFILPFFTNIIIGLLLIVVINLIKINVMNYYEFIVNGIIVFIITTITIIIFNTLIFKNKMKSIYKMLKEIIHPKFSKNVNNK